MYINTYIYRGHVYGSSSNSHLYCSTTTANRLIRGALSGIGRGRGGVELGKVNAGPSTVTSVKPPPPGAGKYVPPSRR